jgi:hypothetical protein
MAFEPYKAKNVDLILGDEATGTNFKCQLRSVTLTPDTNIERIKTLCPSGQFASVSDPEWSLELGYLYGRDSADATLALSRYLLENAGTIQPFTFRPWSGDDTEGYEGSVTIIPGPIGGEEGSFSEQSVSLPIEGQPTPLIPNPSQPTATGAVAGTPGTYTPSGASAPANLAATSTVTASPTTAWTTGQYVVLGDTSHAHWNATAWVTGNAP